MRDPRRSGPYVRARKQWLAQYAGGTGTCVICGGIVDTRLTGNHPAGPTIEHLLPVRRILAHAQTWEQVVALACDTSMWALAHRRCQDSQGARVVNAQRRARAAVNKPRW